MKIDRLNDLPREITMDILSRLPVRTIMTSKCVCKSWRDLVKSPHFASLHSRQAALSSARLPAIEDLRFSRAYSFLGFIDDNELIHKPAIGSVLSHSFPNPNKPFIHSSVNGLLFMIDLESVFICNPITREYVKIDMGRGCKSDRYAFGFGMSKSGQYKIVRVCDEDNIPLTCQVYTLGTRKWKSITIESQLEFWYQMEQVPSCMNGNLHWILRSYEDNSIPPRVYCLDLETELFDFFPCPPSILNCESGCYYALSVLGGCLCFTNDKADDVVEIWRMKEYGDDKTWTKDYVIKRKPCMLKLPDILHGSVKLNKPLDIHSLSSNEEFIDDILDYQNNYHDTLYPVKAFGDGGILLALHLSARLFYYSNVTKVIREIKKERNHDISNLVIHSPNLVSLKSLMIENMRVESF